MCFFLHIILSGCVRYLVFYSDYSACHINHFLYLRRDLVPAAATLVLEYLLKPERQMKIPLALDQYTAEIMYDTC